jgi:hypothetical protein
MQAADTLKLSARGDKNVLGSSDSQEIRQLEGWND